MYKHVCIYVYRLYTNIMRLTIASTTSMRPGHRGAPTDAGQTGTCRGDAGRTIGAAKLHPVQMRKKSKVNGWSIVISQYMYI